MTESTFIRLILYSSGSKTGTALCQANKKNLLLRCMFEIKSVILFRQMQTLIRMENTLATATERLEHTRSIYNELQSQVTNRSIA